MASNPSIIISKSMDDIGHSNKESLADRMALLERRFGLPLSPSESNKELGSNQNSTYSIQDIKPPSREETPAHSVQITREADSDNITPMPPAEHTEKKRRIIQDPMALGKVAKSDNGLSPTTSIGGAQRLSPYLEPVPKGETPNSKSKLQKNTINNYFGNLNGETSRDAPLPKKADQGALFQYTKALESNAESMRHDNNRLQGELERAQHLTSELTSNIARLEQQAAQSQQDHAQREGEVRTAVLRLATSCAKQERDLIAASIQGCASRLGSLAIRRCGLDVQEVWEEGAAIKEVRQRMAQLAEQRDALEAARKVAKRRLPLPGQAMPIHRASDGINTGGPLHPDDYVVQEEIWKVRLQAIRREEDSLKTELARLEHEKMTYVKHIKLLRDQEGSRFNDFPVLNNRYLVLNMLGRGGFSEVFKALDLVSLHEVACKIHQLNSQWSEAKKASYVKHSVREYHIHKALDHPRIVSLLDIFEIDNNTFATILQLADGGDLDSYIKQHEMLPEREAKAIISQVLSGLLYLNTKPRAVIHYDLKPANILFDRNGEVKLTDFGLSKIVDDGHTRGMELTSQGAGTYWYLPPECFDQRHTPLISNKVDVWSVGIIFYQLLFGRRPFGHEQSQEQILRNQVMLHDTKEVNFPSKPAISEGCKEFIKLCLAYQQEERLDVHAAANHPYMSYKKNDRRTSSIVAVKDI